MSAVLDARTRDVGLTSTTISGPVDALRRRTLFVAPVLVLASEYVAFQGLTSVLGPRLGYFMAFAIYWFGWCLLFPAWVLGWRGIHAMFGPAQPRFGRPAWLGVAVLAAPLALGYGLAFPGALRQATPAIVVASLLLAAVNATGEEILWRGVYQRVFPSRAWCGLIWPSLGFALWHFAPQSVRANTMPGGAWSFVLVAGLFGLGWSWLAHQSASIRWTTPAHILFDFAGLGALIYMGPNALALQ